jgi:acetolactate synthase-1/2/3 large subunit
VPKDWDIIVVGGHCFSFAMTHLHGRPAGKYHIPIDFGAIAAIGGAAARNDGKVMLIDDDGSLYQHIQELETVRRHGMKLLICIINDGGYGAETHKFRAHGVDPMHATHGRGDLAQVARGFGLNGTKVTSLGPPALPAYGPRSAPPASSTRSASAPSGSRSAWPTAVCGIRPIRAGA